ncbi:hypothetical protein Ddye_009040 [Dipteronia dyeriana]|uniref:Uncharacterized protein n=1 Tax=Dipteronia dyeriana TaxID=168575 RepID=A0AAD9XBK5_9ROSI|nr:hypothetical protein Ddye_009040 [Dipteronia dyeriana]
MIQPDRFDRQHSSSRNSNLFKYLSVDDYINYGEEMEGFVFNDHIHEPFSPPFNEIVSQFTFPRENNNIFNSSLDCLEDLNIFEMEAEVRDWLAVDDHDDHKTAIISSIKSCLILPTEGMEIENQLGSNQLTEAYSEAIEKGHRVLAKVIARRINEKVSPVGEARERLLYHSFHALDNKQLVDGGGYIKHESSKVFHAAFEAIYRVLVNGMFAHFGANSAILEAMPRDIEILHVVDFDIGEGIQWSSLIVALAAQHKLMQQHSFGLVSQQLSLKITSIKWKEEISTDSSQWRFEETKNRLQDYAIFHGLKLKIDEIELQDLVKEIRMTTKKRSREFLAFNFMWALPHMGRRRSTKKTMEFLNAAKGFLEENSHESTYGAMITYGDGENWQRIIKNCSCFVSFFESYMKHYQALLESMERSFPPRLAEARVAMESLFVAPYVSSRALHDMWREMKEVELLVWGDFDDQFQRLKVSSERLMEAKAMMLVRPQEENLYSVKVEGENNNSNEMVLEWRETPLVRVSAWRS